MRGGAAALALLLGACAPGEPVELEPQSAGSGPAVAVELTLLQGFDLPALERARAAGLFGDVADWQPLEGAGPTVAATLASLLAGAPPRRHGVLSARDVGAHRPSDGVVDGALGGLAAAVGLGVELEAFGGPQLAEVVGRLGFDGAEPRATAERFRVATLAPEDARFPSEWVPAGGLAQGPGGVTDAARRAPEERWFPRADDARLALELGDEAAVEFRSALDAGDGERLMELVGRRRGSEVLERLESLRLDLWLARAAELVGDASKASCWVAVPAVDAPDAGRAWIARRREDPATVAARAEDVVRGLLARAGFEVAPRTSSAGSPAEVLAGFELLLGAGHAWRIELETSGDRFESIDVEGGALLVERETRGTVEADTTDGRTARILVRTARRGAPLRLAIQRDGRAPERAAVALGGTDASRVPLPALAASGGTPWPEEGGEGDGPIARVRREGSRFVVEGEGLDPRGSRVASWPPALPSKPLGGDRVFERPVPPTRVGLGLVRGDRVLELGDLELDGARPAPDALELVLPGGDDVDLAREAEFGPLPEVALPGRVHLRRLGPAFAAGASVDRATRRAIERLPEGW